MNLIKPPSQIAPNADPTSAIGATWEDLEGGFYQIHSKKNFKTRPNTPYGGETSHYALLQGGVL